MRAGLGAFGRSPRPSIVSAWALLLGCATSAGFAAEADTRERAEALREVVRGQMGGDGTDPSVLDGIDLDRASEEVLRVVRVLKNTRADVAFEKQDIEGVLAILRQASGLAFVVSKKARESLEAERPEVTLALQGLPLANVLNLLALQLGDYRFAIRYGAVVLARSDEYRPKRVLRFYPVDDLVRQPPDFPAPPLALGEQMGKRPGG